MALLDELRTAVEKDPRSQAVIAKEAKIHKKSFSAFMNRRRGLSVKSFERLAKALKLTISLAPELTPEREP